MCSNRKPTQSVFVPVTVISNVILLTGFGNATVRQSHRWNCHDTHNDCTERTKVRKLRYHNAHCVLTTAARIVIESYGTCTYFFSFLREIYTFDNLDFPRHYQNLMTQYHNRLESRYNQLSDYLVKGLRSKRPVWWTWNSTIPVSSSGTLSYTLS